MGRLTAQGDLAPCRERKVEQETQIQEDGNLDEELKKRMCCF